MWVLMIMIKIKILSILFLFSIGCNKEDYYCNDGSIVSGLCVVDNDLNISSDIIEFTVEELEKELKVYYPEINNLPDAFKNLTARVSFLDEDLYVNCKEQSLYLYKCDDVVGVAFNHYDVYVEYHECILYSVMAHELLHLVEYYYLDVMDGNDHSTPDFFISNYTDTGLAKETVEHKVSDTLLHLLESCNYLWD